MEISTPTRQKVPSEIDLQVFVFEGEFVEHLLSAAADGSDIVIGEIQKRKVVQSFQVEAELADAVPREIRLL